MSSSDDDRPTRGDAIDADGASAEPMRPDDEEDALDLSDLDALDRAGELRRPGSERSDDDLVVDAPARRARSPFLSMFVIAFAAYLLVSMWSDFRYWMQASEPVDLGQAASFVQDGEVPPGYHDTYVVLEGTPDVQHAARLSTNEGFVGYLRVTEGGGQLFAAIPRGPDETMTNNFEGRYTGRMRRLGSDRAFPWLEQFYDAEGVTRAIDATPEALRAGLERAGEAFELETAEGPVRLGSDDRVRLVIQRAEARVQLGKTTFPDPSVAEARVAELGYPYATVGGSETFHSFVVRIPEPERASAQARLIEGLDVPAATSDPKVGAAVLAMTGTFTVPASVLQLDPDDRALVFAYGDNTTVPGYRVTDGKLEAVQLGQEDAMRIGIDELSAVRIEQPIRLDPDGYVILVGADPSSARTLGLLWLVALGIGLVNVASLLLWLRRRAAIAA